MKTTTAALLTSTLAASASAKNPISEVVSMLSGLEAKVIGEGKDAQKVYEEFAEWCEERSRTLGFEVKTGNQEAKDLKATIAKQTADSGALTERIGALGDELSKDEADLKAATTIRTLEAGVFAASEKELTETIDTIQRAVSILEREMSKGGAAMLQVKNADGLVQALSALVDASAISVADSSRLTAFIQNQQSDSDSDTGAPAGSVYESHSGNIVDTLTGLLEKAEEQLSAARNQETANQYGFDMMRQSLEDEVAYGNKEMDEAKKNLASSGESKAAAEGDLSVTSKELAADVNAKGDLHHQCMTTAEDFEAETKSRGEELAALAQAKKVITDTVSGAESISYGFVQLQMMSSTEMATSEAVRLVRDLARQDKSVALAQLAERMASASNSRDAFGKVKGLIRDMIQKLEAEADADATEKAWCDRNLADARLRKADKTAEVKKLNTRIDRMSSESAQLKEEIAELQSSLAKLAASQVEMNKLRDEEHAAFKSAKAEMELGIEGVKKALQVLGDYYASADKAHSSAEGAGQGIIALLEVVESDFSKNLAEIVSTEEAAVAAYEQQTKENEIEKTTKDQDVKYKTKESKHLDKFSGELSSDRTTVQAELDETNELLAKLEERCVAKAESYEEHAAKQKAEIEGLKQALDILENETAFLQKKVVRAHLRAQRTA